jgi:hypothetical protein
MAHSSGDRLAVVLRPVQSPLLDASRNPLTGLLSALYLKGGLGGYPSTGLLCGPYARGAFSQKPCCFGEAPP